MREETTAKLLEGLREAAKNLPDRRKGGNGTKYKITGFLTSAFSVFHFQHPSMLDSQKAMKNSIYSVACGG